MCACLHGDRALSWRAQPIRRIEQRHDAIAKPQATQSGRGKQRGIHLPFVDFSQARANIAAELEHLEVRTQRAKLRATSQ